MKLAILGYSGSGKSTLAQALGAHYDLPVLHLDTIHFLPDWVERDKTERAILYRQFLSEHPNNWVIDGNYKALDLEKRLEEADRVVLLLFPRFLCLYRCWRRYRKYRHTVHMCMAEGCQEKLDAEFIRWILWESRTAKKRAEYRNIARQYPKKVTVIRSQKQLNRYYNTL